MGVVPTPVTGARLLPDHATILAAARLTPDVAGPGPAHVGRVRSVHRAAIYVDRPAPASLLIVAINDVGGVPGGILVEDVSDLRQTGIRAGMVVLRSLDRFAIPAAAVEIDVSRAVTWSPALPVAARFSPTGELAQTAATARRLAAELAPPGGLAPMLSGRAESGDPWLVRARALVSAQLEALGSGEAATALGPTIDLIGLGIGLTPSGDDYLVGLLAGLDGTGDPARDDLATVIAAFAPARTTAVGAAALEHATRGAFSERLHDVLVAVAGKRIDDLAAAIARAMEYGATSGSDTLVGLLAALDLAAARSRRRAGVAA
jgi:hypothetical protein